MAPRRSRAAARTGGRSATLPRTGLERLLARELEFLTIIVERIKAVTPITYSLSCAFGSHMENPADRCNLTLLLESVPSEVKW